MASADMSVPGAFAGAGLSCCDTDPDNYSVIATNEWGRLIKMSMDPGGADHPHDHPTHYMYVLSGGDLKITDAGGEHAVTMPSGAPPILPAGPHQVANVGTTKVEIIFVEPIEVCQPCNLDGDFVSPFDVNPTACYEKLAEDDKWFTGKMKLAVGQTDTPHSHLAHMVYVLAGDQITIYPGTEATGEGMVVDVAPGAALPVPAGHHVVTNSGTVDAEFVFFEVKM